ncbi:alpha/beta hydrolase [Maribacter sp. PR1]|uniref:Alpha/beta hydrolase n=1 Tax=Maribacter cobaltidurans TaxID=1178778 RepID=A0ABU7IYD8_9FLAO|nr:MULTISPECIES: alpha/beta hydrolase [Maribacter]MDC6390616.1 alpha/beta hydrolase [Maribacter sp. PR1]MEE1978007.1 alpha/beta hydrolase [Maribacter cobaltidurans]
MKNIFKFVLMLAVFQLIGTNTKAQSVPDSTMQQIKDFRAFYETLGKVYPPDSTVTVNETTISGVKSYWFNQDLLNQGEIIVYLHGGVYTYGNFNTYRAMLTHLAKSFDSSILYIEYSLSPEHPYPTANNEIFKVYKALQKKYKNHKITVMGDSAGGGLAVALIKDAQKANLSMPASLALISPWIDLKCANDSYETKQELDPILNKGFLYSHALMYSSNNIKSADPSELKFKKFPPVFLLVGTDEVLNDDARNFYAYIDPIQEKSEFKEYDGQKHVWLFSHIDSKESVEAIKDIKQFIFSN